MGGKLVTGAVLVGVDVKGLAVGGVEVTQGIIGRCGINMSSTLGVKVTEVTLEGGVTTWVQEVTVVVTGLVLMGVNIKAISVVGVEGTEGVIGRCSINRNSTSRCIRDRNITGGWRSNINYTKSLGSNVVQQASVVVAGVVMVGTVVATV